MDTKPVIYLNHWDYNQYALVKLYFKHRNSDLIRNLKNCAFIRYSKEYKCFYFIKSKENLELFFSSFSRSVEINDWYLSKIEKPFCIESAKVTAERYIERLKLCRVKNKFQLWMLPVADKEYPRHILIRFKYNKSLYRILKDMEITHWSSNYRSFLIERKNENINRVLRKLRSISRISISKELEINNAETIQLLLEQAYDPAKFKSCPTAYINKLVAMNYSRSTIANYHKYFSEFVNFYINKDIDSFEKDDIEAYVRLVRDSKDVSTQYVHMLISAIKFYYEKVLGRQKERYEITRPQKECKLPNVMSENEVQQLLKSSENLKHKCILLIIYSAGLRRSEVLNIKISDLNKDRNMIFIRGAKGRKDRYTIFSDKIRDKLRQYYLEHKPKKWLFEGQYGERYSVGSIQKIFEKA
ncbi:tyrosine-type recombinase/integrase [Saccharicrinis sp. 156]|uniref:tyrosine-type recombinase/integrase n=1 Tax=Saccharicrinis sp. 156 TaxID=3417574 RepID=UPI003D3412B7